MSLYDWLLFLHVTGAFFLIGGVVVAGILNLAAIGPKRRPSEIATLYRLIRFAVPLIGAGMLLTLAIGLWLVHESPWNYGYDDAWVIVALVLWALAGWLGVIDAKYLRRTGQFVAPLSSEGHVPTAELYARLRAPRAVALTHGSGLLA